MNEEAKTVPVYLDKDTYDVLANFHHDVMDGFGEIGCNGIIKIRGRSEYGVTVVHLYVDALPYLQRCLNASSDLRAVWSLIWRQIREDGAEEEFFRMSTTIAAAIKECRTHILGADSLCLTWNGTLIKAKHTIYGDTENE